MNEPAVSPNLPGPAPAPSGHIYGISRHLWKAGAVAAAAAAFWSLAGAPLIHLPGMGPLTLMETGRLQGQFMQGALIAAAVSAIAGLGRVAGTAAGIAAGLAAAIGCDRWKDLQDQKAMMEEMRESGSSMGDLSAMLEVKPGSGLWILGVSLSVLILCCLLSAWSRPRRGT